VRCTAKGKKEGNPAMLKEIIRLSLHSVDHQTPVKEIAQLMKSKDVGSVLVCNPKGLPIGIVTDRDIVLRCVANGLSLDRAKAQEVMTATVKTIREDAGLFECIRLMHDAKVRRIPVVDNQGMPMGIVSFGDILSILSKEFSSLIENCTHPLESGKTAKKGLAA
jgi:signal-transduction protein with cAMP-binding, CBS, and nucleotidyltransferase domain